MRAVFKHRPLRVGAFALVMAFLLTLSGTLAPLSLFVCLPMALGISLTIHPCCVDRDAEADAVRPTRGACCERIKAATPVAPGVTPATGSRLERSWSSPLVVTSGPLRLDPPAMYRIRWATRGHPDSRSGPHLYLRYVSLLC